VPRHRDSTSIPLEQIVIFTSLIAAAISGGIGILVFDREIHPYFMLLVAIGAALNLILMQWFRRRKWPTAYEWALHIVNISLLTGALCLTGGLSSPFLLMYAPYVITGAVRKGIKGIARFIVFAVISLLLVAFVTGTPTADTAARLAINLLLIILIGLIAGWLGQRRIDATKASNRHARNLTILNEIGRHLARPADSKDILASLPDRLKLVINFDCYALYLYEQYSVERISLVAASGLQPQNKARAEQTALERHPGWVVRNQQVLRVADTEMDNRVCYLRPNRPRSILYVPLRYEDRCLGAIGLGRFSSPPFSEADEDFLQAVADRAVVCIQNALLYRELKGQAEQLQQAYQDLKELDDLRTEFVRQVSHELRNPLTFIRGHIELMLIDDSEDLTARHQRRLEFVLAKAQQMEQITNDLLRSENPLIDSEGPKPIALAPVVRAALAGAEATANTFPIALCCDIPPDLPPVWAKRQKLNQILDNLISNGIKYSPNGGTINVMATLKEGMVEVAVKDEGVGISPQDQQHVFEPYYRVQGSKPAGHGLGLSIVKKFVEAHSGEIWLESVPGQGTTFFFTLPTTPPESYVPAFPADDPVHPTSAALQGSDAPVTS
jgi:signal transduction histidine kinase